MSFAATRRAFAHKDLPNASSKAPFPISALQLMASCRQPNGQPGLSEDSARRATKARLPKIPSLVFDIEIDDSSSTAASDSHEAKSAVHEVKRLTRPSSLFQHRLVSEVMAALGSQAGERQGTIDQQERVNTLAQHLSTQNYQISLRTALGGGDGTECLHNLRHCYLTCSPQHAPGQRPSPAYIIDPSFKEQFIIACASARYRQVLDAVPEVYVGSESALLSLVQLLCNEMAASFKAAGSVMPPWRQAGSILSKWKPRRSMECAVQTHAQETARIGGQAAVYKAAQQFGGGAQGGSRQSSPGDGFQPLRIVIGGNFATAPMCS